MRDDPTGTAPLDWRTVNPREILDLVQDELPLSDAEARYAAASRAPSTLRGYRTDWREWCAWCDTHEARPLPAPPAHLARFISALADAGAKPGTISRKLAAIRYAHKLAGLDDPTASARVSTVWEGIRRAIARAGGDQGRVDQAPPLMPPVLWDVVEACPTMTAWTTRDNEPSLAGARDRCLLLVGFFGALRRSELARIDLGDLTPDPRGLVLQLHRSTRGRHGQKTEFVALPRLTSPDRCPVRAIETWCDLAGITEGPLLRRVTKGNRPGPSLSEQAVNELVIQAVQRAKVPTPPNGVGYSAQSLRAGGIASAGASTIWDDTPAAALGLLP